MRTKVAALAALLLVACFGSDPNVTESGEGKPTISIEFPPVVDAGAEETATFNIENPGPGDINALVVTFAFLGRSDLPDSLIGLGVGGENRSVVSVSPEPRAVSPDGVVYTFDGLAEGDETSIEFTLQVPDRPGEYANSVTVSDGSDPERARGVPLETRVEG